MLGRAVCQWSSVNILPYADFSILTICPDFPMPPQGAIRLTEVLKSHCVGYEARV